MAPQDKALAAIHAAVDAGIHHSPVLPLGYDRGPNGKLVPNKQAPFVTKAFEARARGASWPEVALTLNASGVLTARDGGFTADSARRLLANRVYLGEARFGEHAKARAHKALTTKRVFDKVQSTDRRSTSSELGPSLLAGVLRCAGCRYLMKPDTMSVGGVRVRNYRCRGHFSGGVCQSRASSKASVIEPEVAEQVFGYVALAQGSGLQERYVAELEAAVEAERLYRTDATLISTLGIEAFREGLKAHLDAITDKQLQLSSIPITGLDARGLRAAWKSMSIDQQRSLVQSSFGAIFIRAGQGDDISERLLYVGVGDLPTDLPARRGTVEPVRPLDWAIVSKRALRRF